MADDADRVAEQDIFKDRHRHAFRYDIPNGVAGECEDCGEDSPRLIGGRCAPCRDGRCR